MLVFKKRLDVNSDNLDSLTEVARAQLFKSWEDYQGEEARSLSDMFEPDNDEGLVFCEHFQVYDDAEPETPKYDVWVLNSDTASVFHAGTAEETGVAMIQGDFDPIGNEQKGEEDSEMQLLAANLQKGYSVFIRSEPGKNESDETDDDGELGEDDIAAEAAIQDDRSGVMVADESDVAADDANVTESKGEPEMIDPEKQVEKALNAGEEDSELIKDDADSDTQGGGSGSGDGVYRTAVDQVSDPEPAVRLDAVPPAPDTVLTAPPKRNAASPKKTTVKKNTPSKSSLKKVAAKKLASGKKVIPKKSIAAAPKPPKKAVTKKPAAKKVPPAKRGSSASAAKGKAMTRSATKTGAKAPTKTKSGDKSKAGVSRVAKSKSKPKKR